jgi:Ca2+-binding RTX toxin-like protein
MFIDTLESRRLMSVSWNIDASGVLNITGTGANDLVIVNEGGFAYDSNEIEYNLANKALFSFAENISFDEFGFPALDPNALTTPFLPENAPTITGIRIRLDGGNDAVIYNTQNVGGLVDVGSGDNFVMAGTYSADFNLTPHAGFTAIIAGAGNDNIISMGGSNLAILAGAGNDNIQVMDADGSPIVDGGDGNDTILARGGHAGIFFGGAGDDLIDFGQTGYGFNANGEFVAGFGGLAFGGTGDDTIAILESNAITAYGGNGNDTLTNQNSTNVILYGENGTDTLRAIGPNATGLLYGGNGNDIFSLDSALVTAIGGAGKDTATITNAPGVDTDQLFSIERVTVVDATTGLPV